MAEKESGRGNWFIRRKVVKASEKHRSSDHEPPIYLGVLSLDSITTKLADSQKRDGVVFAKIKIRLSCVNKTTNKWHVALIYQSERDKDGKLIRQLQATYIQKKRVPLSKVVDEIRTAFKDKGLDIEIVGELHEY